MNELVKIKDVSAQYGITARTLRYYEDIRLIASTRIEDYAHRVYDETAITRLKQILILRKLNISIKDIQHIFKASCSQIVLDMLDKKVDNIDDEIALLHELKEIIMNFINQIKSADFNNDADVKLLYDKANEIEAQLITTDYNGKINKGASSGLTTSGIRLMEITEKLDKKIPDILVIKIPRFLALTSKYQIYDELWEDDGSFKIGSLPDWMNENSHLEKNIIFDCAYFLCKRKDDWWRFVYHVNEKVESIDISPYEVIEFDGGLYAAAVFNSEETDMEYAEDVINKWLESTNYVFDDERDVLENMPYEDDEIRNGLSYWQKLRYIPIKLKEGS